MTPSVDIAASWLVIAGTTAGGWWLARVNRYAKKLGATMAIIVLGLLIANLSGWQPEAGVSSWVNGPLTSLAIVELLLAVELRRVLPEARRLLPPFLVSVLATVFAVLACGWLLAPWLGADASALAALYTATFTGGTLNFVSVGRSLAIPDDLFALATAADYVVFTGWFLLSLVIGRDRHASKLTSASRDAQTVDAPSASGIAHQPRSWASGLLWGVAVMLVTELVLILMRRLAWDLPAIIVLTTVALLMAQLPSGGSRIACYDIGLVLIQPFFAVIGLSTTVGGLFGLGLPVLVYAFLVVAIQALVVLFVRRQQRWALVDSLVASQAAVGGPSTALALASSLGRSSLVLPSVAVGLLGMMLGTYLGLAVEALVQWPAS